MYDMVHYVYMYIIFGATGLNERISHIKCTCRLGVLQIIPGERMCPNSKRSDKVPFFFL